MLSLLINFLGNKTFTEVKTQMEILNINVSEDNDLYMLSFTDDSDMTNQLVRECNGVILEKETNRVVHHCFDKTYEGVADFPGKVPEDAKKEIMPEGSIVRVYYWNGHWQVGTSRLINAAMSFWRSDKSFKELFYENFNGWDSLEYGFCYTFILSHPEVNTFVKNIAIHWVSKCDLVEMEEYRFEGPAYAGNPADNYIIHFDNVRIKVLSEQFIRRQEIMGNHSCEIYAYLDAIKRGCGDEFRSLHVFETGSVDACIDLAIKIAHYLYIEKNVNKAKIDIPKEFTDIVYKLHGDYLQSKQQVTLDTVASKLFSFELKKIKYIVGI